MNAKPDTPAWRAAAQGLLHLFLPPLCPLCREAAPAAEELFCPSCANTLHPLREPCCPRCAEPYEGTGPSHLCPRCRRDPPPFQQVHAWGPYTGSLATAVQRFKYGGRLSLRKALEGLAAETWQRHGSGIPFQAVVPVPPHPETLRRRGFDLAGLLAHAVARRSGVPLRSRALQKTHRTPDLVTLDARRRQAAVARAYGPAEKVSGNILLVDDVVTTTATARACARACHAAGADAVWVQALARTPAGVPRN